MNENENVIINDMVLITCASQKRVTNRSHYVKTVVSRIEFLGRNNSKNISLKHFHFYG